MDRHAYLMFKQGGTWLSRYSPGEKKKMTAERAVTVSKFPNELTGAGCKNIEIF
jgi:hypothetical protein